MEDANEAEQQHDDDEHEAERGHEPLEPPRIKVEQRVANAGRIVSAARPKKRVRDDVAGDHVEDVDAQEASGQALLWLAKVAR